MKRICTLILAGLLLTACQQPSVTITPPTITPDNNKATIVAGVMQTLTVQAATPTVSIQTAVAQTVAAIPTLTAQAATPTVSIETAVAQTVAAIPTQTISQPTPLPQNTPTPTSRPTPTSSTPQIKFTSVPPPGGADALEGIVEGVNPERYGVAVYIQVAGGWWTKPFFAAPVTTINSDGTWTCPIVTGGADASATVIRAYLIPIGYVPPAMTGGPILPAALEKTAVAKVEATRQ